MKSRFLFNQTNRLFGSNIFSMNPNTLKQFCSTQSLNSSINRISFNISQQNLFIASQINNYGVINVLKRLGVETDIENELEKDNLEELESILVSFFFNKLINRIIHQIQI